MSSIWTKSALIVASAFLLSMAALPARGAQQPPPETAAETEVPPPGYEGQSRPRVGEDTPKELRLPDRAKAARRCRSGADTEAEAVEECTSQLNCPTGTTVKCQYRQNHRDWICSCK